MNHCRLPQPRPREYVTPSSAQALSECLLRGAYASDPAFARQLPSSQAARLGTACHHVLELAGGGRLPAPNDPAWTSSFERVWEAAITEQEAEARANPLDAHWPPAEKWRYYSMRKVATRHLAHRLSARTQKGGGQSLQEQPGTAYGGLLRGRPDVIRRAPRHEIEDYKTGSLTDPGSGELRPSYRQQVLLYAVLEHAETADWPERATLIPLDGNPVTVKIESAEAGAAGETALASLAAYNLAVEAGTPPDHLASPSTSACRFCPYAIRCPAFWEAADEDWAAEGILAAAGTLMDAHTADRGTTTLSVRGQAGSAGRRDLWLYELDAQRFPVTRALETGVSVAATALVGAPGSAQLRPGDYTRLVAEP